jgi:O-antigen ligase
MQKESVIKKILITFWIFIIFTINSKYNDFANNDLTFFSVINFLRFFFPFFSFPVIIYLIFKIIKKIKIDLLSIIFFLFGCIQLISFFYNIYSENNIIKSNYDALNFDNITLIIKYFYLILLFILFHNYHYDSKKIFFYLFITISLVSSLFTCLIIKEFFSLNMIFNFYSSQQLMPNSHNFLTQTNPRITGIGRNFVIIFCFLIFYFNDSIIKKTLVYKSIFLFLLFICSFIIWGTQSRGALFCYLLIFGIFLYFNKKSINYKILLTLLIFILPVLLFETISTVKYKNYYNNEKSIRILSDKSYTSKENSSEISLNNYSSGRIQIWKKSLNYIFEQPWIGYGPQGDRIVLSNIDSMLKKENIWDNNSSNAIIYSLLCSGFLGMLCLLTIYGLIIKKIYILIFKYKILNSKNWLLKTNISIILVLLFRSLFENSFALFSTDLLFLISCYYCLKDNYFERKK